MKPQTKLPSSVQKLFWETDFNEIDLKKHTNFVIGRVLSNGGWESLRWLRREFSDELLRNFFYQNEGRNLSPKQLKYWELVLGLDSKKVDKWIEQAKQNPFFQR